jgi:hydroxyethylthiazole kinase-like sugar kinase family protein
MSTRVAPITASFIAGVKMLVEAAVCALAAAVVAASSASKRRRCFWARSASSLCSTLHAVANERIRDRKFEKVSEVSAIFLKFAE